MFLIEMCVIYAPGEYSTAAGIHTWCSRQISADVGGWTVMHTEAKTHDIFDKFTEITDRDRPYR